jgi:hypothetical protein
LINIDLDVNNLLIEEAPKTGIYLNFFVSVERRNSKSPKIIISEKKFSN